MSGFMMDSTGTATTGATTTSPQQQNGYNNIDQYARWRNSGQPENVRNNWRYSPQTQPQRSSSLYSLPDTRHPYEDSTRNHPQERSPSTFSPTQTQTQKGGRGVESYPPNQRWNYNGYYHSPPTATQNQNVQGYTTTTMHHQQHSVGHHQMALPTPPPQQNTQNFVMNSQQPQHHHSNSLEFSHTPTSAQPAPPASSPITATSHSTHPQHPSPNSAPPQPTTAGYAYGGLAGYPQQPGHSQGGFPVVATGHQQNGYPQRSHSQQHHSHPQPSSQPSHHHIPTSTSAAAAASLPTPSPTPTVSFVQGGNLVNMHNQWNSQHPYYQSSQGAQAAAAAAAQKAASAQNTQHQSASQQQPQGGQQHSQQQQQVISPQKSRTHHQSQWLYSQNPSAVGASAAAASAHSQQPHQQVHNQAQHADPRSRMYAQQQQQTQSWHSSTPTSATSASSHVQPGYNQQQSHGQYQHISGMTGTQNQAVFAQNQHHAAVAAARSAPQHPQTHPHPGHPHAQHPVQQQPHHGQPHPQYGFANGNPTAQIPGGYAHAQQQYSSQMHHYGQPIAPQVSQPTAQAYDQGQPGVITVGQAKQGRKKDERQGIDGVKTKPKGRGTKKKRPTSPINAQDGAAKKRSTGLSKPWVLSPILATVCGVPEASRKEVVQHLWTYIKAHKLQDPQHKLQILCDANLHELFGKERVGSFEMNKYLNGHFLMRAEEREDSSTQNGDVKRVVGIKVERTDMDIAAKPIIVGQGMKVESPSSPGSAESNAPPLSGLSSAHSQSSLVPQSQESLSATRSQTPPDPSLKNIKVEEMPEVEGLDTGLDAKASNTSAVDSTTTPTDTQIDPQGNASMGVTAGQMSSDQMMPSLPNVPSPLSTGFGEEAAVSAAAAAACAGTLSGYPTDPYTGAPTTAIDGYSTSQDPSTGAACQGGTYSQEGYSREEVIRGFEDDLAGLRLPDAVGEMLEGKCGNQTAGAAS